MAEKVFSSYNTGKNKEGANQQLFVQIGSNYLACSVKHNGKQNIKEFELFKPAADNESETDWLADLFQSSSLLQKSYSEKHLLVQNETALIVPAEGYNIGKGSDYLNVVYGEDNYAHVYANQFSAHALNVVFRVKESWLEVINQQVNPDTIVHSYTKIVEQVFQKASSSNSPYIKVYFFDKFIIVALVAEKELQIVQTFTYQSGEDVLYYLLSLCQRLQINSQQTLLAVSGVIDLSSSLYNEMKKIFKKVMVEEPDMPVPNANNDFPKHYFTPYFNFTK